MVRAVIKQVLGQLVDDLPAVDENHAVLMPGLYLVQHVRDEEALAGSSGAHSQDLVVACGQRALDPVKE